jgi:hypothetical protein
VGYKRKELQILGGGFNLLPPVDKVPKTDYLQAQNWRVDRLGNLVSRFGYPQKFSITGAGLAHSAFVNGGINGDYYVGCNASIGTPTPSKLYWNFNASAIATGFDGGRIGLACMNGCVYFMNRGKQGRHQASLGAGTSQTWNLAQPANSPTAAAAAVGATVGSATYVYSLQSNPAYIHYLNIAGNLYQFAENGYSAAQIPLVIASMASADPNCTVTYDGTPAHGVVITPIVANTLVQVSGSDGNTAANLANGSVTSLPNGTYTFYETFQTADETLESNPSAVSNPVLLDGAHSVTLTNLAVSADARMSGGFRNIYAIGGTLGQAYQVTTIGDNSTTTWTFSFSDLDVTNAGVTMPTDNDPPPAAAGMVGPHFSRLFAWSTVANSNRLFYTNPDVPQYWPGSADAAVGNWVDVGTEGEAILWCTVHTNILVIYKERSIWMLVGDPDTGYLQQITDALGLAGAFAVTPAGSIDYFVGPGGLYVFDMDRVKEAGSAIRPLFQTGLTSAGITTYGSIQPGTSYNANSIFPYAVALGYGLGKLYIGYAEKTGSTDAYRVLVYHEESQRWFMHYNIISGTTGFYGFLFDGAVMCGLTGSAGGAALGVNVDDFRGAGTTDSGAAAINCDYQSHYEDGGLPDNQKKWLEVVIDYEFAGDTATVSAGYDNGANFNAAAYAGGTTYAVAQWATSGGLLYQSLQGNNTGHTPASSPAWWLAIPTALGTITGTARQQSSFALGVDGVLAKNLSVQITAAASHLLIIHNVYLYYYEEARLALAASTLPSDLGVGKVKQCKELELDIDASSGNVAVNLYSDLPGNALAVRQTPTVTANSGRALMKYPFSTAGPPPSYTEGYLWRVALLAAAGPFRLYAARLLMRVVGTYVEAYEAAGGFVWDSMELSFESAITKIPRTFAIALAAVPIKRFREISLEIETFNSNVTLTFLTDLPGNAQASRFTATVNTGTAGRRFVRLPLPQPTANPPAYAGGTTYTLGQQVWSAGVAYQSLQNGNTGHTPASSPTWWVALPIEGRMCRLQLSGGSKFILYEAAVELLPVGVYIEAYEAAGGAVFDSREQDWGSPAVKEARELELDIDVSGGTMMAQLLSDITWVGGVETPGAIAVQVAAAGVSTTGRQKVLIPLTINAALEQFVEGRLLRLILSGTLAFRLYGAKLRVRAIGTFVDVNEAAGGALWDTTDLDLGSQTVKQLRALELDIWAYGSYTVTVYTDLPGNVMISRVVKTPAATSGRTKVQIPLPQGIVPDNYLFGRLVRVTITSAAAFKLFGARIHGRAIGVYAESYEAAAGAVWDSMAQDWGSPTDKYFDQVRFEMDSDGAANCAIYTDLPGEAMAVRKNAALTTGPTSRHWATIPLSGPGTFPIEGRSIRTVVSSAAGFRLYRAQVRACRIGRYLAAVTPSAQETVNTLAFDFQSGKIKIHKKIEIDVLADGILTITAYTEQGGQLAQVWSTTVTTPNGRMTFTIPLPPGIRGRLLQISLTSPAAARIFRLRSWSREVNQSSARWDWDEYPLENSDAVPAWQDIPIPATPAEFSWSDLPVEPTKPEWQWAPLPVNPTPPGAAAEPAQWIWGKVLSVEETPDVWQWVDVPFEVTG